MQSLLLARKQTGPAAARYNTRAGQLAGAQMHRMHNTTTRGCAVHMLATDARSQNRGTDATKRQHAHGAAKRPQAKDCDNKRMSPRPLQQAAPGAILCMACARWQGAGVCVAAAYPSISHGADAWVWLHCMLAKCRLDNQPPCPRPRRPCSTPCSWCVPTAAPVTGAPHL